MDKWHCTGSLAEAASEAPSDTRGGTRERDTGQFDAWKSESGEDHQSDSRMLPGMTVRDWFAGQAPIALVRRFDDRQ